MSPFLFFLILPAMSKNYYIKNHVLVETPEDYIPGPHILATSTKLADIIQFLVNNGFIAALTFKTENILITTDTTVAARYSGTTPTAVVTGSNEEIVTITIPKDCTISSIKVEGKPSNTDINDSRLIVFTGEGVPANTGVGDIVTPIIGRAALTTSLGGPSDAVPWNIDFGSPGDADIVGVGTSTAPGLSLRLNNLNTLTDKHLLQFIW